MAVQIQLRRGTAAEWTAADPILALGELGLETDTVQFKIGDGVTAWTSLAYGIEGPAGPAGDPGAAGADGEGVPVGGAAGEVLAKIDGTDFNTEWVAQSGGGGGGSEDDNHYVHIADSQLYVAGTLKSVAPVSGTHTMIANLISWFPIFVTTARTLDRIGVFVTTLGAGAECRLGIYNNTSDTDLRPDTVLLDAGTVDCSSTGEKLLTIDQDLAANTLYWAVCHQKTSTGVLTAINPAASVAILGIRQGVTWQNSNIYRGWYKTGQTYASGLPASPALTPLTNGLPVADASVSPAIGLRYSA